MVQILQVKYVEVLRSLICRRWSKFFRRSPYFAKISYGGFLFLYELAPGGTNFGRSIFTMTVLILLGNSQLYTGPHFRVSPFSHDTGTASGVIAFFRGVLGERARLVLITTNFRV